MKVATLAGGDSSNETSEIFNDDDEPFEIASTIEDLNVPRILRTEEDAQVENASDISGSDLSFGKKSHH